MMKIEKPLLWGEAKNEWLKTHRGYSFQDVADAINDGHLINIVDNVNPKYPHQKTLMVELQGYVMLVPCVESNETVFLKTAFYSRKANKKFKRK